MATDETAPDGPDADPDVDGEATDAEIDATLLGYPALVSPGSEVPARIELSNLAWDTIYDSMVPARDGFLNFPPTVREVVEDEVENAGYQLVGLAGFEMDVDTADLTHALELDVVLTGNGGLDPEVTPDA